MAVRFVKKKQALWVVVVFVFAALVAASWAGFEGPRVFLKVVYVPDGDTILLQDKTTVRYIGIDAPETGKQHLPAQPFSKKARSANQKLVKNGVRLMYGPKLTDRYGRTLAYVYTDKGVFVNAQILRFGFAWCLFVAPNTNRFDELLAAQRLAMNEGQGIWADLDKSNGPVVGNPRSMRFHLPQHYPPTKNNRLFNSAWDAFYEGYAPCANCLPNWQKTKWPKK